MTIVPLRLLGRADPELLEGITTMLTLIRTGTLALFLVLANGTVQADTSSIGTSRAGGSVHTLAVAIASAAQSAGMDLRVTPFNSTTQAIPLVANGELVFGLANAYELQMAKSGTGVFDGRPLGQLRTVSALYPFRMSLMVRSESGIESFADLAGRRVPAGFGTTATGEALIAGMMAAAGVSYDDATRVNVSSFGDMRDAFEAERTDAMITVLGTARDVEIAERVGGVRVLSLPGDAAAEARMQEFVPVARAQAATSAEGITGLNEDIFALTYDYYLYTSADVSDSAVTALLQAIVDNAVAITATSPPFSAFSLDGSGFELDLERHPGALQVTEAE
jgi:uncharacterized protein